MFPGLPRVLSQLSRLSEFETWKPDREVEWFEQLERGGDYPREWPLILRPAVTGEFPAKWYVEDGSGRDPGPGVTIGFWITGEQSIRLNLRECLVRSTLTNIPATRRTSARAASPSMKSCTRSRLCWISGSTIRVLLVVVSALCIRTCCKSSPKSKIFFKGEATTDYHKFYRLASSIREASRFVDAAASA